MAKSFLGIHSPNQDVRRIALLVLLGIAVHLILPQITTLKNSWQVLLQMQLWAVALAFVVQILSYVGSGYLLQQTLLIARQKVSLMRSTLIVFGAASIGMVAGGMVGSSAAIFRWTSAKEGSLEGATLASLVPSLFNNLILVLLSMFGLVHLIVVHNLTQVQAIGFSATLFTLCLLISIAGLLMHFRTRATTIVIWVARRFAHLRLKPYDVSQTRDGIEKIFAAWSALWKGKWHKLLLGAFLNALFDTFTLYFLFIAAGNTIGVGVLLSGYALPLLLGKMAFILPGGVGVVESSMSALYTSLGIPNATTVVVVLGYRLISFWIPSLVGFPVAAYLQTTRKNDPQQEQSLDPVL